MAPLEIRHRSVRPISAKHAQASRFLQQSPLLAAVESADAEEREAWRSRGAAFFQGRGRKAGRRAGGNGEGGHQAGAGDRKSVVEGKSVSVRVDLGGRRIIKKKKSYS